VVVLALVLRSRWSGNGQAEGDSLLMEEYCLEIEGMKRGTTFRMRDKRFGYYSNVSL
jgi:hypothetical protein